MAQLWKYDSIVGNWHMEDGADSVGSNTITLTGTSTVAGKLNNAQSFTTNDYGVSDGLVTSLASVTKGTIAGWVKLDDTSGSFQYLMSLSKLAGTGATDHRVAIRADYTGGGTNNRLDVFTLVGGVLKSQYRTDIGSLNAHIGSYLCYEIEHDGTSLTRIQFNGSDENINTVVSTDETLWFSDIITSGADTFSWGSLIQNSTRSGYLNGDLDETMINSELWDATDRAAFWNGGSGQEIAEPSGGVGPLVNKGLINSGLIGGRLCG